MLKGSIRTSQTGQNKRQKQVALKSVGITDLRLSGSVYENDREAAITSLQPGDVFLVSEPSRLGGSTVDVMSALEAVGKRGASVMRADTGETGVLHGSNFCRNAPYPAPSAHTLKLRTTKRGHAIKYLRSDADLAGLIAEMPRLKATA